MPDDPNNPLANDLREDEGGSDDFEDALIDGMGPVARDEFESFLEAELGPSDPVSTAAEEGGEGESHALEDELPSDAEPEEPSAARQPETTAAPPAPAASPTQKFPPSSESVQPRWKFGDEELTAVEIVQKGIFNQVMSDYQRLLLKDQMTGGQQPGQAAQPDTQQQMGPEDLQEAYAPVVDNLVRLGYIRASTADNDPGLATGFAYTLDTVAQLRQEVAALKGWAVPQAQAQIVNESKQRVLNMTNEVAGRGDLFEPLKTDTERDQFLKWVETDVNPLEGMITPDFLARMYVAYKYNNPITQIQQQQKAQKTRAASPEAANASSERVSARPRSTGVATDKQQAEIDEMISYAMS